MSGQEQEVVEQQELFAFETDAEIEARQEKSAEAESEQKPDTETETETETKTETETEVETEAGSEPETETETETEAETKAEAVEPDKGKDEPTTKSGFVPYPRFRQVIDERNALREQISSGSQTQEKAPDVKQEKGSATEQQGFSQEALRRLKEVDPDAYDYVMQQQAIKEATAQIRKEMEETQKQEAKQNEEREYQAHFSQRIRGEFNDVFNKESAWFQQRQPYFQKLAQEYPGIQQDVGLAHLALRYADLQAKLDGVKDVVKKEVRTEEKKRKAEKKAAVLAGAATTSSFKQSDDEDPFGEPPKWEQKT